MHLGKRIDSYGGEYAEWHPRSWMPFGLFGYLNIVKTAIFALGYVFVTTDSGFRFDLWIAPRWEQNDVSRSGNLCDAYVASHALDLYVCTGPGEHAASGISVHPDRGTVDADQRQFHQDEFAFEGAFNVIATMLADDAGGLEIKRDEGAECAGARAGGGGRTG
jgi:hypothetical protein